MSCVLEEIWVYPLWVLGFGDLLVYVIVQSLSRVQLSVTLWTAARQASWSFSVSQDLLKLMSTELVMTSSHLIPFSSCPQYFPASASFPMSWLLASGGQNIGASASASFLSNEYSELISFRIDKFDLIAVQGTLKSLLQHHSSKA